MLGNTPKLYVPHASTAYTDATEPMQSAVPLYADCASVVAE